MDSFGPVLVIQAIIISGILWQIRREATRLREKWMHLIIPTIFLWWIVYPLWLFLWPGLHRASRTQGPLERHFPVLWAKKRLDRE